MTHKTTLRILTGATILALLAGTALAQDETTAVLLRGTALDVPVPVSGQMDWTDAQAVHFRWDGGQYAIPSAAIIRYEWSKRSDGLGQQLGDSASKLGRAMVPFVGGKKYLTIDFRSADGQKQYAVFEVPKTMMPAADPVLQAWTETNSIRPVNSPRFEHWWADRYFKTKRNAAVWEQKKAEASPADGVQVATRDDE